MCACVCVYVRALVTVSVLPCDCHADVKGGRYSADVATNPRLSCSDDFTFATAKKQQQRQQKQQEQTNKRTKTEGCLCSDKASSAATKLPLSVVAAKLAATFFCCESNTRLHAATVRFATANLCSCNFPVVTASVSACLTEPPFQSGLASSTRAKPSSNQSHRFRTSSGITMIVTDTLTTAPLLPPSLYPPPPSSNELRVGGVPARVSVTSIVTPPMSGVSIITV